MRFVIGKPPDDPGFEPDPDMGWRRLREMGPGTLMVVGTLLGVPLAVLIGFLWSLVPLSPLTFSIDEMGLASSSAVLLPVLFIAAIAALLVVLIVVHELVHVFAFPCFGLTSATIFGVWPSKLLPYASHSGPVSRERLMVVALTPLIVLSVLPVLVSWFGVQRSPLWALLSILNAVACGGDVAVCVMLASRVPFGATLQSKGWTTWWRPAEQLPAREAPGGSSTDEDSWPPAG